MARTLIRYIILGAAMTLGFAASVGFANTKTLTGDEARAVAWRALQTGRPQITLQIADALVEKSPMISKRRC